MAKALAQFTVTRTGGGFLLSLEDEDGDTIEMIADADQLDEIIDAVEEQLEAAEADLIDEDEDDDEEEEAED